MINENMPTNAAHWAECALCGRVTWVSTEKNWCTEPQAPGTGNREPGTGDLKPGETDDNSGEKPYVSRVPGCKFRYLANHKAGETPATNAERLLKRLRNS